MLLSPTELRDVHVEFGTPAELVGRRRATYSAAVELASNGSETDPPLDVLDSPVARAHLAEVIRGTTAYQPAELIPMSTLVRGAPVFSNGGAAVHVVADREAGKALDGALRRLDRELDGSAGPLRPLLGDDAGYEEAAAVVVAGLDLAVKLCPALAGDLLPHVTLFVIVESDDTRLGSASLREHPGLIVVPRPKSAFEVAEALIHEGAHQKIFDLALTRSILDALAYRAPLFRASWSDPLAAAWPFEQCLAAFHAYSCMATFWQAATETGQVGDLPGSSLLAKAETRADELGSLLLDNAGYLAHDGQRLLSRLATGRCLGTTSAPSDTAVRTDAVRAIRDCGEWTLVALREDVIELYWLPTTEWEATRM